MKFYTPLSDKDRDFFDHFIDSMDELSNCIHKLSYSGGSCHHRKLLIMNLRQSFPIIVCEEDEGYREELKVRAELTYQDGYVFYREGENFHNIPTRWDDYEQLVDLAWKDYSRAVRCPECGYADEVELFFKKIRNRTVHVPGALGVALARFMEDFTKMNPAEHRVSEYDFDKRKYLDYADGFGAYALTKKVLGFTGGESLVSNKSATSESALSCTPSRWYANTAILKILLLLLIFEIIMLVL